MGFDKIESWRNGVTEEDYAKGKATLHVVTPVAVEASSVDEARAVGEVVAMMMSGVATVVGGVRNVGDRVESCTAVLATAYGHLEQLEPGQRRVVVEHLSPQERKQLSGWLLAPEDKPEPPFLDHTYSGPAFRNGEKEQIAGAFHATPQRSGGVVLNNGEGSSWYVDRHNADRVERCT